jgi:hypothetical protein
MRWLALLLPPLCLAAEPVREAVTLGSVTANVEVDARTVSLSGALRVTLRIEGTAPLRVTLPKNLLAREVATFWRIRPVGPAKTEPLPEARERFEQRFEVSPYRAGEAVPFLLAEITVLDGAATDERQIKWEKVIPVAVETRVTDPAVKNLHPPTSIETLPGGPAPEEHGTGNHLVWLLPAVVIGVVVYRWPRRKEPVRVPYTREWTLFELDRLRQSPLPPVEWCERFAFVLRHFIERERQIPATRLTSDELVRSLPDLPDELSGVLAERLRLGDRIRFTSAESTSVLPFIPHDWISWSADLIETLSPAGKVGDSREVGQDTEPK